MGSDIHRARYYHKNGLGHASIGAVSLCLAFDARLFGPWPRGQWGALSAAKFAAFARETAVKAGGTDIRIDVARTDSHDRAQLSRDGLSFTRHHMLPMDWLSHVAERMENEAREWERPDAGKPLGPWRCGTPTAAMRSGRKSPTRERGLGSMSCS